MIFFHQVHLEMNTNWKQHYWAVYYILYKRHISSIWSCLCCIYMSSSFEELPGGDYLIWLILWLVSLGISLTLPNAQATRGVWWEGLGDWRGDFRTFSGGGGAMYLELHGQQDAWSPLECILEQSFFGIFRPREAEREVRLPNFGSGSDSLQKCAVLL